MPDQPTLAFETEAPPIPDDLLHRPQLHDWRKERTWRIAMILRHGTSNPTVWKDRHDRKRSDR